jgi:hypothetical protein
VVVALLPPGCRANGSYLWPEDPSGKDNGTKRSSIVPSSGAFRTPDARGALETADAGWVSAGGRRVPRCRPVRGAAVGMLRSCHRAVRRRMICGRGHSAAARTTQVHPRLPTYGL